MIQKRSIALCIVLTFVTCGIYGLYWIAKINDEINAIANDQQAPSGGVVILLSIVTCGIYSIYWCYKMGEKVDYINQQRGIPSSGTAVLYLVLGIFISIVAYALMQDSINKTLDFDAARYQQPNNQ